MNNRRAVLSAGMGLALFFVLLAGFSALRAVPLATFADTDSVLSTGELSQGEEEGYLVRTVDNEVCVFHEGQLILHTGVHVNLLPQQDREALEAGIFVPDEVALTVLLEDLDS